MKHFLTISLTAVLLFAVIFTVSADRRRLLMARNVAAEPTPDIWWGKLNEGSGTTFASTISPNGTNTAAWTTATPSGSGAALLFTGTTNSYKAATVGAVTYGSASTITVTFWARMASTNSTKMVLESSTSAFVNAAWEVILDANALGFLMGRGVASQYLYQNMTPPPVNTTNHFAVIFDRIPSAGTITVYMNGSVQSLATVNNNIGATGTFANFTLHIGNRDGNANFFDGMIDDVRIYNGALNVTQIDAIRSNPQ